MMIPAAPQDGISAALRQAEEYHAELRRSQPVFALTSFAVVRLAIHPRNPAFSRHFSEIIYLTFPSAGVICKSAGE